MESKIWRKKLTRLIDIFLTNITNVFWKFQSFKLYFKTCKHLKVINNMYHKELKIQKLLVIFFYVNFYFLMATNLLTNVIWTTIYSVKYVVWRMILKTLRILYAALYLLRFGYSSWFLLSHHGDTSGSERCYWWCPQLSGESGPFCNPHLAKIVKS